MLSPTALENLPPTLQTALLHSKLSVPVSNFENGDNNDPPNAGQETPNLTILRPEGSLLDMLSSDGSSSGTTTNDDAASMAVCNLVSLQPFSIESPQTTTTTNDPKRAERIFQHEYESAFAIAMAVDHLNSGDGSIIDELYTLHERTPCGRQSEGGISETNPLRFATEFINTQSDPGLAVDEVMQVIARNENRKTGLALENGKNDHRFGPCAFLGEASELVTSETSIYTGHKGFTQATGTCDHCSSFDDENYYPKFVRTIPDTNSIARAFISFLVERNFIKSTTVSTMEYTPTNMGMSVFSMAGESISESEDYPEHERSSDRALVVIHVGNDKYDKEAIALQEAVKDVDPTLWVQNLRLQADGSNVVAVVSALKELKFGFIYGIFGHDFQELMNDVMVEAYRQGVAGGRTLTAEGYQTHNWFFSPTFMGGAIGKLRFPDPSTTESSASPSRESILYKAYRGAGMIWVGGAGLSSHVENDRFDTFQYKLKKFRDDHMEELESMVPLYGGNQTSFLRDPSFLNPLIDDRAQFSYEATILMGLAACRRATGFPNKKSAIRWTLGEDNLYNQILRTSFESISGDKVELNYQGNRESDSTYFKILNFYDVEPVGENTTVVSDALYRFQMNPTDFYHDEEWIPIRPFVFSDGTMDTPRASSIRSTEWVGLSQAVLVITLIFCGLAVALSLLCIAWTVFHRKSRVVRASQPFFLYLVCAGSMILALAIVPLSIDHTSIRWKSDDSAASCTATLWMVSLGFTTIFSALFSKTFRINKIMNNAKHFKRIKVRIVDTLVPMVVLISCNLLILTTMTVLDPIEFERFTITEDRFGRPTKEYGGCAFVSHDKYIWPLLALNATVLTFAMYQAWRARYLSTEFAETQYIFLSLFSIFLVSFIGVPILLLVKSNPNASHFIGSAILFVSSISIQLFLFVPKYRFLKKGEAFALDNRRSSLTSSMFFRASNIRDSGSNNSFEPFGKDHPSGEIDEGEVILSTKSPRALAQEVASLRRRLHALEDQEKALVEDGDPSSRFSEEQVHDRTETSKTLHASSLHSCRDEH